MNIKDWVGGSDVVAIRHNEGLANSGLSDDQIESKVVDSLARQSKLKQFLLPVLLATTVMGAGCSTMPGGIAQQDSLTLDSDIPIELVQAQAEADAGLSEAEKWSQSFGDGSALRLQITEGYETYDEAVGTSSLIVVSQSDPNIKNILSELHPSVLPGASWDKSTPLNTIKANAEQMLYSMFMSEGDIQRVLVERALAQSSENPNVMCSGSVYGSPVVCFASNKLPRHYDSDKDINMPTHFGDEESNMMVMVHELTHALDHPDLKYKDLASVIQIEAMADITAAIYSASKTGNWDTLDHTIRTFRDSAPYDNSHESSPYLDQIKEHVSLSDLDEGMSISDARSHAMNFMRDISRSETMQRAMNEGIVAIAYRDHVVDGTPVEDLLKDTNTELALYAYQEDQVAGAKALLEKTGLNKLEGYLNHMNYKSLETDPLFANAALNNISMHAKAFGLEDVQVLVQQQQHHIDNGGALDVKVFADAMDLNIDYDSKHRLAANNKAVESEMKQVATTSDLEQFQSVKASAPESDRLMVMHGHAHGHEGHNHDQDALTVGQVSVSYADILKKKQGKEKVQSFGLQ